MPIITIADEPNPVADYIETLLPKWSAFDGQPHIKGYWKELLRQKFRSFAEYQRLPQKGELIPRHEMSRWRYRANPYLQEYEKVKLLEFREITIRHIARNLIKGAPKLPFEQMVPYWEKWTHFLEEVDHRGLDLKELDPFMATLCEEIEEMYKEYNLESL